MKVKIFTILLVIAFAVAALPAGSVQASAFTTTFITSITYQNVGGAATTSLGINFYPTPSTTTPIFIDRPNLAAGASTSLSIGSVSAITSPFQGSAVMESDQPLLATLVQTPQSSTTVFVRPMSNGFSEGAPTALIATVLKNASASNTIFSIQNVDSVTNIVTFKFYNTSAVKVHQFVQNVEPGASYFVKAATISQLGTSFNGSAVVTATHLDGTTAGSIVGSAMEMDISGNGAKAFESVATGSNTIYMPSALCDYGGVQRSAYAVANTSLTTATHVTVTYKPGNLTATATIGAGAKASFKACDVLAAGFIGSAIITTTPGDPAIVAVGKVSGGGLSTAFLGADSGAAKIALPYVRYAPDSYYKNSSRQRTSIAVQNVGTAMIPAGSIKIKYADNFGHNATFTYNSDLAIAGKFSNNPGAAGLTWFGSAEPPAAGYGGGATIECTAPGCQLIAIARVSTYVSATEVQGEDYNGLVVP